MPLVVKKLRCRLVLLSGLGLLLVLACWLWYADAHPNLRAKVSHVRQGLTMEQVHEIMGGPPGDYRNRTGPPGTQCYQGPRHDEWQFDDGDVMVTYSVGGFGPRKSFEVDFRDRDDAKWQMAPPGLIDRLTAMLGF